MHIAIIPARGGSKRIPRKNVKPFCGKPIIAYSIEAALKSELFDAVIVSTDDEEIASVAKVYGAQVPFMRPAALSDDFTPTIPVIAHAITTFEAMHPEREITTACCIYATAPFVQADALNRALATMQQSGAHYVFSATTFAFPIERAIELEEDGAVQMLHPEHFLTRSQDLPERYHDAGQFYMGTKKAWMDELPFFAPHSRIEKLPRHLVQDIDTPEDWLRAELMYKALFL